MLDVAQGRNCHSSNFLRTISYLPRVREYGLVDDDERSDAIGSLRSSGTTVHHSFDTVIDLSSSTSCSFPLHSSSARRFSATSFTPLLEHFTRYILQRLHDESIHNVQPAYRTQPMPDEHVRAVEQQFGYNFHITSVCLSCQTEIAKVPTKGFTVTLGYPNLKESGFTSPSFATSLRRSMSGEYEFIDEDGLCPTCGTYQPIRRTKELTSLPNTLCILADVNEERVRATHARSVSLPFPFCSRTICAFRCKYGGPNKKTTRPRRSSTRGCHSSCESRSIRKRLRPFSRSRSSLAVTHRRLARTS